MAPDERLADAVTDVVKTDENKQRDDGKNKQKRTTVLSCLRRNIYVLLLVAATCGGYIVGFLLQPYKMSSLTVYLIGFPGKLMFRALMMIIVPLLFCSLVLAVCSLRKGGDAIMVAITLGFFLSLSSLSSIMGATAGHLVHPGQKVTSDTFEAQTKLSGRKGVILDSMLDLLRNAVPNNVFESTFMKEYTDIEVYNVNNITSNLPFEYSMTMNSSTVYMKRIKQKNGINFMGLLTFSILFGCALATLGENGNTLHQVIEQTNAVIMSIMTYFLKLLPIGLFFWMFREGLQNTVTLSLLRYLGMYLATGLGCVAFHQFLLLPLLYVVIVRKNPIPYHLNLLPAIFTAFGTASSAATLPATVKCAEDSNQLNRCVTGFVLPLGMAVHMNGLSYYVPLTCIFLAQLEGIFLGVVETIIICVTAVLLSISAPATTFGGSPVYVLTAMAAVGIETPKFLSIFLSLEWLMERFRTLMNVVADSYVAAYVEKICQKKLPLDTEKVEYTSPVIDGYNHPTMEEIPPPAPVENVAVCRCCGSRIDVA